MNVARKGNFGEKIALPSQAELRQTTLGWQKSEIIIHSSTGLWIYVELCSDKAVQFGGVPRMGEYLITWKAAMRTELC